MRRTTRLAGDWIGDGVVVDESEVRFRLAESDQVAVRQDV